MMAFRPLIWDEGHCFGSLEVRVNLVSGPYRNHTGILILSHIPDLTKGQLLRGFMPSCWWAVRFFTFTLFVPKFCLSPSKHKDT